MTNRNRKLNIIFILAAMSLTLALAGCGGSGGGVVNCMPEVSEGSLSGNAYAVLRAAGAVKAAPERSEVPVESAEDGTDAARAVDASASATNSVYMPVKNVTITCGDKSTSTDEKGHFRFNQVSVSMKECRAVKTGYIDVSFGVDVKPGMETAVSLTQDVFLTPAQPQTLSVVTNIPDGAEIYIDGSPVYNTGNILTGLSVATGTYEIVVAATGYERSATATVEVSSGAATASINLDMLVTSIAVTPQNGSYDIGEQQQFTATCTYYDSSSADCSNKVAWSTDNAAIASVGDTGLVTTIGSGSVNVTALRSRSNVSGSAAASVSGFLLDRTCDGVSGVCFDLIGGATGAGGNVSVSAVITNAPASGVLAGEMTFDWGAGMTLNSVVAGTGIEIDSQNLSAASRRADIVYTVAAPYGAALTSGTTVATFQFTTDTSASGQIAISWAATDDLTDFTDNLLAIWNQGTFTLRDGYVNINAGATRITALP